MSFPWPLCSSTRRSEMQVGSLSQLTYYSRARLTCEYAHGTRMTQAQSQFHGHEIHVVCRVDGRCSTEHSMGHCEETVCKTTTEGSVQLTWNSSSHQRVVLNIINAICNTQHKQPSHDKELHLNSHETSIVQNLCDLLDRSLLVFGDL